MKNRKVYSLLAIAVIMMVSSVAFAQKGDAQLRNRGSESSQPEIDNLSGVRPSTDFGIQTPGQWQPEEGLTDGQVAGNESGTRGGEAGENVEIDIWNDASINIYPNPAVHYVEVDLGSLVYGKVSILNMLGQEVYQQTGEFDRLRIDVTQFETGIYFVAIHVGDKRVTRRIKVVH